MRIGLIGIDSSHADDFLRLFNEQHRFHDASVTAFWSHDGDAARIGEITNIDSSIASAVSLDTLLGQVDAVLVGSRDGGLHRDHALAAIAAGRPTFIDKPLALTVDDAEAILDAGERAGVPVCSASALRWQDDTVMLKARLAYLERPLAIEANGTWYPASPYGGAVFYAVHTIELVQELLGTDWRNVVRDGAAGIVCDIAGVKVTLRFSPPKQEGSHFSVTASCADKTITQRVALPDDYMAPVAQRLVDMVRIGISPLNREQLLAPVLMMQAIDKALA
ncbi:MAG: Gfo/Idh/MocA family oxidoreductase [Devosia sp.]